MHPAAHGQQPDLHQQGLVQHLRVDTASTRCTVTSNHSDGTSTTKSFVSS
ncbi:hypothetical protein [Mycobacterium paraffinicum]|nr:hypothetical protein [Mycobacterium paraffinicum]